jgi:hypothetical protein
VRQLAKSFLPFFWICQVLVWLTLPDTTCCAADNHRKAQLLDEEIALYSRLSASGIYRN